MSFEEAYGFYDQGGQPSYQPKGSMGYGHGQGFYYPSGMGTSHGPQVGPSASARFEYDNPLTRELLGLTARMGALELRQEELGHSLDHNTSLTQESWGMLSSLSYDWHHGTYYPRHSQTSSPELR